MTVPTDDEFSAKEFGALQERVRALDSKFDTISRDVKKLGETLGEIKALAERGKGAYWSALGITSAISGGAAFLAGLLGIHKGGTP